MPDDYDVDLTVNDALALLLGLDLDHIRGGRFDSLLHELKRSIGLAATDLEGADTAGCDEQKIEALKAKLDKASERYDEGMHYYILLVGEITRIRQGFSSRLVLVKDDADSPLDYSGAVISRASFLDWSQDLPAWSHNGSKHENAQDHQSPTNEKFTKLDKEKHQVTIALLLELIKSKHGPEYTNKDGGPNMSKIASDIRTMRKNIDSKGYSEETLAERFSAALKTRKEVIG